MEEWIGKRGTGGFGKMGLGMDDSRKRDARSGEVRRAERRLRITFILL